MLVERIDAWFAEEARQRAGGERRVSAHNAGGCVLALWYGVHEIPGEPLDADALRRMAVGDATEALAWVWLTRAGVKFRRALPADAVDLEGIGRVKPDAFLEEPGLPGILECKRMGDYPFEKARDYGEIGDKYTAQAECYMRAYDEPSVLVLCVSDGGALHELVVKRDDERWARLLAARKAAHAEEPPPRPYVLVETCTGCEGTGRTPVAKQPHKACGGTGRVEPMLAAFPCSFCAWKEPCWESEGRLEEVRDARGKRRFRVVKETTCHTR